MEENQENFHETLASEMNEKDVSVEELAHHLGTSPSLIKNKWLQGEMLPVAASREKILSWVRDGGMKRVRIKQ